mmetsp:Transcript_681/g.2165  ORF Transcript_681/g.2165 Transcript_681/m.2165 type:complete len:182 (-) Transcript_681:880-1425(-)
MSSGGGRASCGRECGVGGGGAGRGGVEGELGRGGLAGAQGAEGGDNGGGGRAGQGRGGGVEGGVDSGAASTPGRFDAARHRCRCRCHTVSSPVDGHRRGPKWKASVTLRADSSGRKETAASAAGISAASSSVTSALRLHMRKGKGEFRAWVTWARVGSIARISTIVEAPRGIQSARLGACG